MTAELVPTQEKSYQAYNLKMAGLSMSEIAERLEYPSANAVVMAIRAHIQEDARGQTSEFRQNLLQMELDRLDFMLSRIWPQIEHGDLKAVDSGIKIVQTQARIAGIDQIDASTKVQTVLVVGGEERDYVAKLKEIAGEEA